MNSDLTKQLAAAQLENRTLREALITISKQSMGEDGCYYSNRACIITAKNVLKNTPTSTDALDKLEAGYQLRIKGLEMALRAVIPHMLRTKDADKVCVVASQVLDTPTDTSAIDKLIAEEREKVIGLVAEMYGNSFPGLVHDLTAAIRARSGK